MVWVRGRGETSGFEDERDRCDPAQLSGRTFAERCGKGCLASDWCLELPADVGDERAVDHETWRISDLGVEESSQSWWNPHKLSRVSLEHVITDLVIVRGERQSESGHVEWSRRDD